MLAPRARTCTQCLRCRRFYSTPGPEPAPVHPPHPPASGVAKLTNRRLIALSGQDVPHFLQGMVTNNVRPGETRGFYAAFLNAQVCCSLCLQCLLRERVCVLGINLTTPPPSGPRPQRRLHIPRLAQPAPQRLAPGRHANLRGRSRRALHGGARLAHAAAQAPGQAQHHPPRPVAVERVRRVGRGAEMDAAADGQQQGGVPGDRVRGPPRAGHGEAGRGV
ncbi:hypothetical protein GP486_006607 [Trichoglossum hirsutum]|uniref:Uncharacterized protein n=1 Tax=Trichoglossum hirsutum TaxID=265104 RepID=A0A9P8IK09_9PEZI|nr:hypothetical protein GP486_006607 [Trichoglossum hirsutum]